MYPGSGGSNYGYGRGSGLPSSSKNQQHSKYTAGSSTGYGVGGTAASASIATKATRSREPSYGTSK